MKKIEERKHRIYEFRGKVLCRTDKVYTFYENSIENAVIGKTKEFVKNICAGKVLIPEC